MASKNLPINIRLEAQTEKLKKQLARAQGLNEKYKKQTQSTLRKVSRSFSNLAKKGVGGLIKKMFSLRGAIISAVGIGGMGYLIKRNLDAIDATAKFSRVLGVNVSSLQALHHAFKINGVEINAGNKAIQNFTKNLAEVAVYGIGEAKDAFEALGIEAKSLMDLPLENQLAVIAEAFNKVENSTEQVGIAYDLFGGRGVALSNVLREGAEGILGYRKEIDDLGLTLSNVDAGKVEEANDAMTRLRAVFIAVGQNITVKLAPIIKNLTDYVRDLSQRFLSSEKDAGGLGTTIAEKIGSALIIVLRSARLLSFQTQALIQGVIAGLRALGAIDSPEKLTQKIEKLTATKANLEAQIKRNTAVTESFGAAGARVSTNLIDERIKVQELGDEIAELTSKLKGMQDVADDSLDFDFDSALAEVEKLVAAATKPRTDDAGGEGDAPAPIKVPVAVVGDENISEKAKSIVASYAEEMGIEQEELYKRLMLRATNAEEEMAKIVKEGVAKRLEARAKEGENAKIASEAVVLGIGAIAKARGDEEKLNKRRVKDFIHLTSKAVEFSSRANVAETGGLIGKVSLKAYDALIGTPYIGPVIAPLAAAAAYKYGNEMLAEVTGAARLRMGGVVDRESGLVRNETFVAGNTAVHVGEADVEAFFPVTRRQGKLGIVGESGGGQGVNVEANFYGYDPQTIPDAVDDELKTAVSEAVYSVP